MAQPNTEIQGCADAGVDNSQNGGDRSSKQKNQNEVYVINDDSNENGNEGGPANDGDEDMENQ